MSGTVLPNCADVLLRIYSLTLCVSCFRTPFLPYHSICTRCRSWTVLCHALWTRSSGIFTSHRRWVSVPALTATMSICWSNGFRLAKHSHGQSLVTAVLLSMPQSVY